MRLYLPGPVLALLLHQRGLLVLHVSAGESRRRRGGVPWPFWSWKSSQPRRCTRGAVRSSRTTWWPWTWGPLAGPAAAGALPAQALAHVVTALGESPEDLPRIHASEEKRARVADTWATSPRPLRRVYVLTDAEALDLEPLAGHAAVFELLQHSDVAPALERLGSPSFLAQCARLAAAVPVRRLRRPRSLARLGALAAAWIEADAGRGSGAQARSPSRPSARAAHRARAAPLSESARRPGRRCRSASSRSSSTAE